MIIASRTESKVQDAIEELVKGNSGDAGVRERLSYVKLDLNSLKQVEKAAEEILAKENRLDGVVCNAGIMALPYKLTEVSSGRLQNLANFFSSRAKSLLFRMESSSNSRFVSIF